MPLFTTALGLYGGVLWIDELQGFIIHEMVPTSDTTRERCRLPVVHVLGPVPRG
jgi:hypothetical protein